ncbi:retrotransposon ORF1 [Tanacetum coccineum]
MAYHDKYKKILDEIWKDKVELDGKIIKEDQEAVNENALADTGSNINTMPNWIYEQLGREDMKKVDRGITMIIHSQAKAIGILTNVLCQVGVTTLIAKFLILDIPIERDAPIVVGRGFRCTIGGIVNTQERLFMTFDGFCHQTFRAARSDVMRNAESNSDDEEEYQIKRSNFGALIYRPKPAPYLNCNDPTERSLDIQTVTNPFWKISVWKKAVSFLGSLPVPLNHVNWKPDYNGSYTKEEEEATGQWRTEIRLIDPIGCDGELDDMLRIRLREAESNEEIFTFVAWIRVFNINEPIYVELYHELYLTYEFDKVCADDELQTKKIIKFRLGGRDHSLTLLEFGRMGLYHADELEEDDFNVYFEGGLRSDEHFNAQEHQNGYANVAWLIARWLKRKGAGTQKESQISCGQFISKISRKCTVLTEDVVRSLSALIYCRDLDTTPLRDLIDSKGKLIHEDPQPGVPRVGIPRPLRASMQDLYDRMGRMKIR